MPRAKHFYLPGYIYHITHRCHNRDYLLKFNYEKKRYLYWLQQCIEKYSLKIISYCITDNHIHLIINPGEHDKVIAQSMHLAAGCTAQEYNRRKNRKGAFWEDRYHATAIQCKAHLLRCMLYIDYNMVRAGVVSAPELWEYCGFYDLMKNNQSGILDKNCIISSTGYNDWDSFKTDYVNLVKSTVEYPVYQKDDKWTKSIAVGDEGFVAAIKSRLGVSVKKQSIFTSELPDTYILKEPTPDYNGHEPTHNYELIDDINFLLWNPEDEIL